MTFHLPEVCICSWPLLQVIYAPQHGRAPGHPALVCPLKLPDSSRTPDVGPHHRCSIPSVHPGTAYQHLSGSSIGGSFGGSFSGTMPSGFAGGGGGSLAAMLAAQQGSGFGAGPGSLGPWGPLDAQVASHIGQPGGFARVSGPQPVPGIVNPFAVANPGGGSGALPGTLTSGSGSGASMFNAALALGGVSGPGQFASRAGAPGCMRLGTASDCIAPPLPTSVQTTTYSDCCWRKRRSSIHCGNRPCQAGCTLVLVALLRVGASVCT